MTPAAIAAATVVVLRDGPDGEVEVLLLERHAATAFAGGAMIFPGGRVEAGDAVVAGDPALASGFTDLDPVDAVARVAAARETIEEAGIMLSSGSPLIPGDRAAWRDRLNAATATFGDVLAATGHRLDARVLVPFAHWTPPDAAPIVRRFDTRFYLARLPAGEAGTPDGSETVTAHWTTPATALARADAGKIALVFPTRRNLERLAQYATVDALFSATAARPVVRIQPAIVERGDGAWLTIPAGCDYPVTEEAFATVRRE